MSAGVNKWIGIGNVCSEPESRKLANGGTVTSVRIACNDRYKNKTSGEMVDKTEFVRVTFFGRLAEIAGEYLKKGSQVYVEGRLKTDKYTDKEGIERYSTGIVANELQLLGGPGEREAKPAAPTAPVDEFDDEIPF